MTPLRVVDAAAGGTIFTVRASRSATKALQRALGQGGQVAVANALGKQALFTARRQNAVVGPLAGGRAHVYVNQPIPPSLAQAVTDGAETRLLAGPMQNGSPQSASGKRASGNRASGKRAAGMGLPEPAKPHEPIRLTTNADVPEMQPPLRLL